MMKQQKGFTLVEMAIVLVIVGLLLGGVLKGQELIENSRIKSAMNDLKGFSAANNGYFDRYHRQAGDDGPIATLNSRGGAFNLSYPTVAIGNLNGVLDVTQANTFTGASPETYAWFSQVRASGYLTGDYKAVSVATALPINAFGGLTSVTGNAVTGMAAGGKYVCMGNVPGGAARSIDVLTDDGVPNRGALMSTLGNGNVAPGAAATTYVNENFYTICTSM
jgi:prepilin-type N-terminal cleavage/methylation domain-containing protein